MVNLLINKNKSNAIIPTRAHSTDAGLDLYSTQTLELQPLNRVLVDTGIIMAIPEGFYGRIAPRSGLAYKNGIDILAGVIDSAYRKNIGVILYNTDKHETFNINEGDRIAQIIIERCYSFPILEVTSFEETERKGGFGSTGI